MTILHASDVHFGKPHLPELSGALVRFVHRERPDAVVVSGDLTMRAKAAEFRAARVFLDALAPYPLIVTVGNHDVPLYRVWERFVIPFGNYRGHMDRALDTVIDLEEGATHGGARFVTLNSCAPRRAIVNGRIGAGQFAFADRAFAAAPAGALRILVVHHNLVEPADGVYGPPLRGAHRVLRRLPRWGVDLVLSGHIHRTHLASSGPVESPDTAAGVPILMAGTATSDRGRGRELGKNSFNLVRVGESGIDVEVYLYSRDAGDFLPGWGRRYPEASP
ncbi:MAG: metallophosphoesterase [Gemmatimonadota bacterium]|nr:metallophosphoesterase [Gemmatimonadota bacterium]MDE2870613.1 metallophosphoesterase [Gemmatimonadota bacterium]